MCVSVLLVLTVSANIVLGNIFGHDFPKCIIMVRNQTNVGRDGSAIGFGDFRTYTVSSSNPTLATIYGYFTSPSLAVACKTCVAAFRLNSAHLITCYHPFILCL